MKFSSLAGQYRLSKQSEQYNHFLSLSPSLSSILSHSGTLQEIQNSNPNLESAITSDYLSCLLSLILQSPDDYASPEEAFKFPFIASQFFSSKFSKLSEKLLQDQKNFSFLLNFLETPEPLPVLSGYFSKTCEVLLENFPETFLIQFIKSKGHLKLIHHLKNSSLSDFLSKILLKISRFSELEEHFQETLNEISLKLEEADEVCCFNIIGILKKLGNFNNFEISGFWVGLMRKNLAFEQTCVAFKRFLMGKNDFFKRVLEGIRSGKKILRPACLRIFLDALMILEKEEEMEWVLNGFCKEFQSFVQVVKDFSMGQEVLTTLEIFKCVLNTNKEEIALKIAEAGVFEWILMSLEKFPFCTFLHNLFSSIFSSVFNSNMQKVKDFTFKDLNILDFIIKNTENPLIRWKKCETRKGFVPHLFFLANLLESLKKTDFFLHQTLKSNQNWKKFTRSTLQTQNCIESRSLGGNFFDNFFEKSDDEDPSAILSSQEFNDVEFWRVPLSGQLEEI